MANFDSNGPIERHNSIQSLTHSQKQIWIGQRLQGENPLYNMGFTFVFPAELRADLFCLAWQQVVDRSDALRTRVPEGAGGEVKGVLEATGPATTVVDFSSKPNPRQSFHRWSRERCTHPLPLGGELVDSVLVLLGDGKTGWYLNQHHLVTDAWSTLLLYSQVGKEYEALLASTHSAGTASAVTDAAEEGAGGPPSPGAYYSTVAAVLDKSQQSRATDRSKASVHWRARQETQGRRVPLYGHRANGSQATGSTASTRCTLELGESQSRAFDRTSRQRSFSSLSPDLSKFSLWATLLVSWLHRISGNRQLGFDAPVAGRPTAEAKAVLGLFIEMFPFAVSVDPRDTFRSLGAKCLEESMLLLRHGLPGTSSPSGSTASNIVLNYFPGSFDPFAGIPAEVEWVHPGHGDRVHALRLQVHDFAGSGRYTLHFDFNEAALPGGLRSSLQSRALEHFEKVLEALLEDPDQRISTVDLLVEEEQQALASLHRAPQDLGSAAPLPDRSVVALFEAQSSLTPDRVALRQGRAELSFAALRHQCEALAAVLIGQGVEPGDRVAILSRRSIPAVVAIGGTLRARAAYVPMDPSLPEARLDHLLRDSGARLLLTGEGVEGLSTELGVPTLAIAEGIRLGLENAGLGDAAVRALEGQGGASPTNQLPALPSLDDLAYLLYTSGSTGQPKGVLIEHGGLADYLTWAARQYVRGDQLTFPLFTSLAFDLTVTSLFLPLITGGTLEIYPEGDGPVDTAVVDVVQANAVDFIKLTPSHLSVLIGLDLEGSRLRRMVVGGENLRSQLAATISDRFDNHIEITNEYGPTEAVVGCVAHRFDPRLDTALSVPIGLPADHVQVEILNEALAPVPEGVPGELWVSRFGLARGYHRLDRLTAERFQPGSHWPGQRRYRTGDLVRWVVGREGASTETLPRLEYLGRLDRQVKISGFRIEPGETESAMLSLGGIEQCVVVAKRGSSLAAGSSFSSSKLVSPRTLSLQAEVEIHFCTRCGLPSNYPRATFDAEGVCSVCHSYESIKEKAQAYFKTRHDLTELFERSAQAHQPKFDCMMLFSGGKDSTYALCQLVEMGLSVYAFTLDNGYIAEGAKENIRKVAGQLGVPVEFASTPAMKAIFRDSLRRFSNVCNGCFKTIYTLSLQRARELKIPIIVTGLSRGQMFETRLTEEMFRDGRRSVEEIDATVLAARKVYHRVEDEVARSLDVEIFRDNRIFEEIHFVDFYRYHDVGLEEVLAYLRREVPWVRPEDTGRSTNCLINDAGIYIHKQERGFHNYALPYSWDVRLGHKTREEALAELNDDIDPGYVRRTLADVGYASSHPTATLSEASTADPKTQLEASGPAILQAFYVASEEVSQERLLSHLREHLPPHLIPALLKKVDAIPLTTSGKVDEKALSREASQESSKQPYRLPEGPVEEYLTEIWQQELWVGRVGADDHFFELGGTSLAAIQVMLRLCQEFDIDLPLDGMFSHPTLSGLARIAEDQILADAEGFLESDP